MKWETRKELRRRAENATSRADSLRNEVLDLKESLVLAARRMGVYENYYGVVGMAGTHIQRSVYGFQYDQFLQDIRAVENQEQAQKRMTPSEHNDNNEEV